MHSPVGQTVMFKSFLSFSPGVFLRLLSIYKICLSSLLSDSRAYSLQFCSWQTLQDMKTAVRRKIDFVLSYTLGKAASNHLGRLLPCFFCFLNLTSPLPVPVPAHRSLAHTLCVPVFKLLQGPIRSEKANRPRAEQVRGFYRSQETVYACHP